MNDDALHYFIFSGLPPRRETPALIGAKFLDSLDALSRTDPLFTRWSVLDEPAEALLPIDDARTRIATIVENNVVRNDYDQPSPKSGYSAIGVTDNATPSRVVILTVEAGAVFSGEIWLRIGDPLAPTDPLIVNYQLFRKALLALAATWLPPWACANIYKDDYWKDPLIAGAPLFPYSIFHIPWIAYLSPALAVRFALPAEVRTERMPDGGLLMTVTEEPPDLTNPDHMRRARILAEAMIARTGSKWGNRWL